VSFVEGLKARNFGTLLKGRESEANREGLRSFAMNQKRPSRGSLEVVFVFIFILIYSVEARLNLPNSCHILVNFTYRPYTVPRCRPPLVIDLLAARYTEGSRYLTVMSGHFNT
jgi:hypothetical protein